MAVVVVRLVTLVVRVAGVAVGMLVRFALGKHRGVVVAGFSVLGIVAVVVAVPRDVDMQVVVLV